LLIPYVLGVHNGTRFALVDEADGGDEVVAQVGKAEDLGAAIDTGVHRPPRRIVTQREGSTHDNGPAPQSVALGAQPVQGAIEGPDKAAIVNVGVIGVIGVWIEIRHDPTKTRPTAGDTHCHCEAPIGIGRRSRQQRTGVRGVCAIFGGRGQIVREFDTPCTLLTNESRLLYKIGNKRLRNMQRIIKKKIPCKVET
jgi:hypothetical protein